jgi:hypothetical protein
LTTRAPQHAELQRRIAELERERDAALKKAAKFEKAWGDEAWAKILMQQRLNDALAALRGEP